MFSLSKATLPIDAGALGRCCAITATAVAEGLLALEQAGLVDASRARLTMKGLAAAVLLQRRGALLPSLAAPKRESCFSAPALSQPASAVC